MKESALNVQISGKANWPPAAAGQVTRPLRLRLLFPAVSSSRRVSFLPRRPAIWPVIALRRARFQLMALKRPPPPLRAMIGFLHNLKTPVVPLAILRPPGKLAHYLLTYLQY